jgi:hypothetical protein
MSGAGSEIQAAKTFLPRPDHLDMRISLCLRRSRLAGDRHPIISWSIGFVTLVHRKD